MNKKTVEKVIEKVWLVVLLSWAVPCFLVMMVFSLAFDLILSPIVVFNISWWWSKTPFSLRTITMMETLTGRLLFVWVMGEMGVETATNYEHLKERLRKWY